MVAVEHDENFMREADYIIDMGPLAGIHGGMKIYEGGFQEFLNCTESKTSPYLSSDFGFPVKNKYRPADMEKCLTVSGANLHNLQDVCARIPLGVMVGIAGVSGSCYRPVISPSDLAYPAISKSIGPIGVPFLTSSALILPYSSAAETS